MQFTVTKEELIDKLGASVKGLPHDTITLEGEPVDELCDCIYSVREIAKFKEAYDNQSHSQPIEEIVWQDCDHAMDRSFDKIVINKLNELIRDRNK